MNAILNRLNAGNGVTDYRSGESRAYNRLAAKGWAMRFVNRHGVLVIIDTRDFAA